MIGRTTDHSAGFPFVRIYLDDWDSPVAAQHMRGVSELPYVVVHGRSGKRVARISGLALDRLDQAIAKARHR